MVSKNLLSVDDLINLNITENTDISEITKKFANLTSQINGGSCGMPSPAPEEEDADKSEKQKGGDEKDKKEDKDKENKYDYIIPILIVILLLIIIGVLWKY
mgnify:CR=1 FL=1